MARAIVFLIMAVLIAGMIGCVPISQNLEIQDWYDLDAVRNNLGGSYILMNDLDSTTAGYEELASPTANGGKGWEPIGTHDHPFNGALAGQEYEIHALYINLVDEWDVGLLGNVDEGGYIKDIGIVDATVIGSRSVGTLIGDNYGTVSNSFAIGNVTGDSSVGGLVGANHGTVSRSYTTGSVTGSSSLIGGLVGWNSGWNSQGLVRDSYSSSNVTGYEYVGGLVGLNDEEGDVNNSHAIGSVTGNWTVGGLIGFNLAAVSDSYTTGNVTGENGVGGLVGANGWASVSDSYSAGNVIGDDNVGGLVGANAFGSLSDSYATGNVTGENAIGGLVGWNWEGGTVSSSYSTGSINGNDRVGGLVGLNELGSVSNSYSTSQVAGNSSVGGLFGWNEEGTVSNSFWDTQTSGQATSDGGTGKNTTEMQDIDTFSGAAWEIIAVADPGTRNLSYIWNIVDDETYPFLSWQAF